MLNGGFSVEWMEGGRKFGEDMGYVSLLRLADSSKKFQRLFKRKPHFANRLSTGCGNLGGTGDAWSPWVGFFQADFSGCFPGFQVKGLSDELQGQIRQVPKSDR